MKRSDLNTVISNPIEREYFEGLLAKLDDKSKSLKITTSESDSGVYPTAIAPKEMIKDNLPFKTYEEIKASYSTKEVLDCTLWLRKMHGG